MDWSHRHVIFSQPSTDAQAAAVMHDPRYWQQFNREHFVKTLNVGQADLDNGMFANSARSRGDWSENLGSGANAGAGVYPAKYSFSVTTANCGNATRPDTVVFSTGLPGVTGSQANIVAFDNLYSGCTTGTVPQVYWAYNTGTGTGYKILTSPISSEDGTQVAFVQTSGAQASLVLLKWAPGGTIRLPAVPTNVSNALYRGCTAPCMTTIALMTGPPTVAGMDDTTSSVFPDYGLDVIWVGGQLGWLNKFTGVFQGIPARVTTGGFPVQVRSTNFTSSPVFDSASNSVFIGDGSGYLERISSTGTVTASGQLDFGTGIVASPVVDSTSGKVYVFASSDSITGTNAAVYQFPTNFAANSTGTKITVGVSSASPNPMFAGGFDSSYFGSGNATGNLYVCGNTGGAPTLYRIPINAGTMAAAVAGPALSSSTTAVCSPVTDVPNPNTTGGATEWIFASAQAGGLGNSCGGGGCAMNFVNTPWLTSHAYTVGQQVLDSRFNVQTCRVAGTSRTAAQGPPAWNAVAGGSTADAGTLRWINQGPQAAAHGTWLPSNAYAVGNSIIDSNGNIQVVTTAGTSRTAAQGHPTWVTTIYTPTTADNTVRWRNGGLPATASLAATGGTGGIIVDNVVGSGTMTGASQIYFSTQGNQACGTTGTGGCAVQASQSALK